LYTPQKYIDEDNQKDFDNKLSKVGEADADAEYDK